MGHINLDPLCAVCADNIDYVGDGDREKAKDRQQMYRPDIPAGKNCNQIGKPFTIWRIGGDAQPGKKCDAECGYGSPMKNNNSQIRSGIFLLAHLISPAVA